MNCPECNSDDVFVNEYGVKQCRSCLFVWGVKGKIVVEQHDEQLDEQPDEEVDEQLAKQLKEELLADEADPFYMKLTGTCFCGRPRKGHPRCRSCGISVGRDHIVRNFKDAKRRLCADCCRGAELRAAASPEAEPEPVDASKLVCYKCGRLFTVPIALLSHTRKHRTLYPVKKHKKRVKNVALPLEPREDIIQLLEGAKSKKSKREGKKNDSTKRNTIH